MVDILAGFREFLLSDEQLRDDIREESRQAVRNRLRAFVFEGTVPRGTPGPIAATLDDSAIGVHQGISTLAAAVNYYVDVTLWCRDTDEQSGRHIGRQTSFDLIKFLAGYRGPLNDDVSVQCIFHRNGPDLFTSRASDASGNWTYQFLLTFVLGVTTAMPSGAN